MLLATAQVSGRPRDWIAADFLCYDLTDDFRCPPPNGVRCGRAASRPLRSRAPNTQVDLAATFLQFFSDLTPRIGAAYNTSLRARW